MLTHWKGLWCWEGLGTGGEWDDRGWDGWMASLTRWTWVWVNSRIWWWTGMPGVLPFMGSQRVRHYWATELNWLNWDVSYLTISTVSSIERDSKLFPPLWFSCDSDSMIFFFFLDFGKLHSTWGRFGKTSNWKWPRGMVWGGRREEGSGWGTHVYLWRIHFDIWQN